MSFYLQHRRERRAIADAVVLVRKDLERIYEHLEHLLRSGYPETAIGEAETAHASALQEMDALLAAVRESTAKRLALIEAEKADVQAKFDATAKRLLGRD